MEKQKQKEWFTDGTFLNTNNGEEQPRARGKLERAVKVSGTKANCHDLIFLVDVGVLTLIAHGQGKILKRPKMGYFVSPRNQISFERTSL